MRVPLGKQSERDIYLFICSQHYQEDADGLCCRLKYSVEKEGLIEFDVSAEDFKASGWHIPRAQLVKKSSIGKGEYGGRSYAVYSL